MSHHNNEQRYREIADALLEAYSSGVAVEPPRTLIADLDLAGAYRIQQLQEQAFEASGRKVVGRKIGLTSLAMQEQLGVDSPDFGFFTEDLVFEDGAEIEAGQFIAPKVEPELGFVLGADLSSDPTMDEVVAAVDSVRLAVEIIDSRVADWDIRLVDTVADNASCGAVILGDPIEVPTESLPDVPATMLIDGEPAGSGTGAAVMGHPLEPLKWLAGVLGEQGVSLQKGDVILTGSFCAAAAIGPGQSVEVDYGPYGSLSARFI